MVGPAGASAASGGEMAKGRQSPAGDTLEFADLLVALLQALQGCLWQLPRTGPVDVPAGASAVPSLGPARSCPDLAGPGCSPGPAGRPASPPGREGVQSTSSTDEPVTVEAIDLTAQPPGWPSALPTIEAPLAPAQPSSAAAFASISGTGRPASTAPAPPPADIPGWSISAEGTAPPEPALHRPTSRDQAFEPVRPEPRLQIWTASNRSLDDGLHAVDLDGTAGPTLAGDVGVAAGSGQAAVGPHAPADGYAGGLGWNLPVQPSEPAPSGPGSGGGKAAPLLPSAVEQTIVSAARLIREGAPFQSSVFWVTLEPPELGRVELRVRLRPSPGPGVLEVDLRPQTTAGYNLLAGTLDGLKESLQGRGIVLAGLNLLDPRSGSTASEGGSQGGTRPRSGGGTGGTATPPVPAAPSGSGAEAAVPAGRFIDRKA